MHPRGCSAVNFLHPINFSPMYGSVGQQKEIEFTFAPAVVPLSGWKIFLTRAIYRKSAIEGRPAFDKRRASEWDSWLGVCCGEELCDCRLSGDRTAQRIQGVVFRWWASFFKLAHCVEQRIGMKFLFETYQSTDDLCRCSMCVWEILSLCRQMRLGYLLFLDVHKMRIRCGWVNTNISLIE